MFYAIVGSLGDSKRLDWAAILTDLPRFRAQTRPSLATFGTSTIYDCAPTDAWQKKDGNDSA
jgi:hypothetical protein